MLRSLPILAAVTGLLLIVATLLPLSRSSQWFIRVFDFPRLQIAVLCAAVVLIWLVAWNPRSVWQSMILGGVVAAMFYQLVHILPYTSLAPVQAAAAQRPEPDSLITVLITNVLMDNRESSPLLSVINEEDPDIVLAVEVNDWWQRELAPVTVDRPHVVSRPLDNTYGMMLYSRWPLTETVIEDRTREGVPSIRTTVVLPSGDEVDFYGLHPPPPFPGIAESSVARDAELVLVARDVRDRARPAIVAGDLNDVAWSRTTKMFQRISRLLDPRIGRGLFNSFHAEWWCARWPLDHIFFSDDFALVAIRRLPAIGSDHFPMLAQITLVDRPVPHQMPTPRTGETVAQADDILKDARHTETPPSGRTTRSP